VRYCANLKQTGGTCTPFRFLCRLLFRLWIFPRLLETCSAILRVYYSRFVQDRPGIASEWYLIPLNWINSVEAVFTGLMTYHATFCSWHAPYSKGQRLHRSEALAFPNPLSSLLWPINLFRNPLVCRTQVEPLEHLITGFSTF